MPTYEYECPVCQEREEYREKKRQSHICPVCGVKMNNVISLPAIRVKGGTPIHHGVDRHIRNIDHRGHEPLYAKGE